MKIVFNSHLWRSFKQIPEVVGSLENYWATFHAATVEVAAKSCGSKSLMLVLAVALWWIPEVKGAIKLKKETYRSWLACGTTKATNRYQQAERTVAQVVNEKKNMSGRSLVRLWNKPSCQH